MWKCSSCGESAEEQFDACWNCGTGRSGERPSDPSEFRRRAADLQPKPPQERHAPEYVPLLGIIGVICSLIGLYFLVGNPSAPGDAAIVNLQKLTIGETLTICGVILIAAEWRPR